MAKTVNDNGDANSVIDYDVTSFLYSKHQAEDELKLVENKLRDNGMPLDDYDGTKSVAWSNAMMLGGIGGGKSTTSEQTKNGELDVLNAVDFVKCFIMLSKQVVLF